MGEYDVTGGTLAAELARLGGLPVAYPNGAAEGYVWTSDANGNGSWQPPASLPSSGGTLTGPLTVEGPVDVSVVGDGLQVAEGANAKQGTATLVAGTVTVANTSVTANSKIFVGQHAPGGTVGAPFVSSVTAGTGFTIKSTSSSDTSTVAYEIFEPG